MKLKRTTSGKRTVTTVLVDEEVPFNVRISSPKYYPTECVTVDLGYDAENRSVALSLSMDEAEKLAERLADALASARVNSERW